MINIHFGLEGIISLHKGTNLNDDPGSGDPVIPPFKNMILDTGLQRIGQNADWMNWLHLGTGIQAPHPLQNSLQNATYKGNNYAPTKHTTVGVNITDPQNPFTWIRRVFRVTPRGESRTYSELGVGWNDNNLFSRTLIKDPNGNPNTISILGDEYLDVTYECRMYMPVNTAVYSVTPTGDDKEVRTVTVHASALNTNSVTFGWGLGYQSTNDIPHSLLGNFSSNMHNRIFTGGRGGLYGNPEGNQVGGAFNYTTLTRINDVSAEFTFIRELPDNVGLLRTIQISQQGYCFQMEMNPPFNKNEEERFSFSYTISWGRL